MAIKNKEHLDGAKAEMSPERITSMTQLGTKADTLRLRFELEAQNVADLKADASGSPEALQAAMERALNAGKGFVLASTYEQLAKANSAARNNAENGPDIRAVANPGDYEKLS